MKKWSSIFILFAFFALILGACGRSAQVDAAAGPETPADDRSDSMQRASSPYTADTPISDVIHDPAFGAYGRLIFPVNGGYYSGSTLGELRLT